MPHHPDRVLPLQGASNFRDLGGYPGHAGRPLRWRRLFRSDHLAHLTEADRDTLARLGVARSFDFRGVHERAAQPYALPGLVQHALSIEPTVVQRMNDLAERGQALDVPTVAGLMDDLYRALVNDQAHRFAELFEHLLADDSPAVFHCTAGKDRTGFAAALILLALGVDPALVRQDYLLTNAHYRRPRSTDARLGDAVMAVVWQVQERFLDAALQAVEQDHGGIERYLSARVGLSDRARAALAERYLQRG